MFKQFKEFAFKGNLVDMAVGFILGGAFATVVKSLVSNVIMPPLGAILGKVDFTKMKYEITSGTPAIMDGDTVVTPAIEPITIQYGQFITDAISFILLAFIVFIVVKKVMVSFQKKEEEEVAAAAPPKQEVLLEQILEELKK